MGHFLQVSTVSKNLCFALEMQIFVRSSPELMHFCKDSLTKQCYLLQFVFSSEGAAKCRAGGGKTICFATGAGAETPLGHCPSNLL